MVALPVEILPKIPGKSVMTETIKMGMGVHRPVEKKVLKTLVCHRFVYLVASNPKLTEDFVFVTDFR